MSSKEYFIFFVAGFILGLMLGGLLVLNAHMPEYVPEIRCKCDCMWDITAAEAKIICSDVRGEAIP